MKKLWLCLAAAVVLIPLAACAASKATGDKNMSIPSVSTTRAASTTTQVMTDGKGGYTGAGMDMSGINAGLSYGSEQSSTTDRMIIRTGDMTILVEDITGTLDKIKQLAEQNQGYVVTSQQWKSEEKIYASISIRIPADDYDMVVEIVRGYAAEVTSMTTSSQDVTEEYTDLNSKLTNLEAAEQQLLEIMKRAVTVEDVLAVQSQLTSVRSEIEQIKGRMQYLERTSSTSLLNINLQTSKLSVKIVSGGGIAYAGETVNFFAEINGGFSPYSYEWDFGDSDTSNAQTAQHQYKSKGTYNVSLKVTDDKGNSITETRKDYITVKSSWDAGNTVSSAWHGLITFGRVLLNVIIWLGIFSPLWLLIGGIVWWRIRRRRAGK